MRIGFVSSFVVSILLAFSAGTASGQQELDQAAELSQEAEKLHQAGKYAEAIPLAQKALEIREKVLEPEHPDVAVALTDLANLHKRMGNYSKAVSLYQRALTIQEKRLGVDHLKVAVTLSSLAGVYHILRIKAKAISLDERALAIWEKARGPEHKIVEEFLSIRSSYYKLMGYHAEALAIDERRLAIHEKLRGSDDPEFLFFLNDLADSYEYMGNYTKAEPLLQRALALVEKTYGPTHTKVVDALEDLAALYMRMENDAKAEPLLQRALAIEEKTPTPKHTRLAFMLDKLARRYREMGDSAKAESLSHRTLAVQQIREKALDPDHKDAVESFCRLASWYRSETRRDYAKAVALYERALTIQEKKAGADLYDVPTILTQLAQVFQAMGDYAKAESLLQRTLVIRENASGAGFVGVLSAHIRLGLLHAVRQQYRPALQSMRKGLAVEDNEFHDVFTFTTEEQKLEFVQSRVRNYHTVLSLIQQHLKDDREAVQEGLELVLSRKGIVFNAQSRVREGLRNRLSEQARREWDLLSARRSELAQLLLNKPQTMNPEQYKEKVAALQRQIEQSEQRLADESALVAKELEQRKITVETVAKALPKNAALVEFSKIQDFDFADGQFKPSWRYLAFVLSASGDVSLLDLGDAAQLEGQVQRVLRDIKVSMEARGLQVLKKSDAAIPSRPSIQSLKMLHAQVWAPLQAMFGSVDKIVVSPDGLLNLVPFAALLGNEGHAVVESYQLAYVTSGRELVAARTEVLKPETDLLLVANPTFDGTVQGTDKAEASLLSRDFRGVFNPLPGTAREAQEIPPLVTGQESQKRVLQGINATEHVVKTTQSPRILHLATHGFFLQDEENDLCAETRGLTVMKKAMSTEKALCEKVRGVVVVKNDKQVLPRRYENPLVRSGLAFTGANKAAQITEGDDGILTALEITGMDLYGTELVVLSACDTGVGEIKTGEGVFGLRRAFALAGAKNLLMSLWPVNDAITANQMKAFYQNMQKLPPAEALRQAQLETLKELKVQYNGAAPPGLWAPFILQGGQALGR